MTVSDYLDPEIVAKEKGKRTSCNRHPDAFCPMSKNQVGLMMAIVIPMKKWKSIRTSPFLPMQFVQLTRELEVKVYKGLPSTETFKFLFN